MNNNPRPAGMHPDTFARLLRASACAGYPPPPVVETVSHRFRNVHAPQSDGQFTNEQGASECYSSVFVCSLQLPTSYQGQTLQHLALCLVHQGIPIFAPVVNHAAPHIIMVAFDTNLCLPMAAVTRLITFIEAEDEMQSTPYSQAWARDIPRLSWLPISRRLRANISQNSHVSF